MNLNIKTGNVRYNNKILISDGKFSLGENDKVNASVSEPVISMPGHKVVAQPTHAHNVLAQTTHEEEKVVLILCLTGAFTMWYMLQ